MSASIELGRAVLSTSTTNFELWLRTLITISPQQHCTDFKQYDATSLLNLLSSSEVWVSRGNGMYIDLDITFKSQPLADNERRHLSQSILGAPVWEQLNLRASLSDDLHNGMGKLRIAVNYPSARTAAAVTPRHRLLSNTSTVDVRLAKGIPAFFLDSIVLFIDIFEPVQRRKAGTAKRLKTSTDSTKIMRSTCSQADNATKQKGSTEVLMNAKERISSPTPPLALKRMQSSGSSQTRTTPLPATPPDESNQPFRSTLDMSAEPIEAPNQRVDPDITTLQTLIDGALRLSVVSCVNNKLPSGVKIKANTFGPGLADIAPALWRPEYSLSLSQRVNLLPIICRSLCQSTATGKAHPTALEAKLAALMAPPSFSQILARKLDQEPAGVSDGNSLASCITLRLWLHLQKNTPCKPVTQLHSFMTAEPKTTSLSQSDEMLENLWQGNRLDSDSRPGAAGLHGSRATDIAEIFEDHPTSPATYAQFTLEQHFNGIASIPNHILEVLDDDLLLGDECVNC